MPIVEQFNESKEYIKNSRKLYTFSHNGVIKVAFLAFSPRSLKLHPSLCCRYQNSLSFACLFLNYTHTVQKAVPTLIIL